MTTWNHRVWQVEDEEDTFFEIRETYYNSKGEVVACTEEATRVCEESLTSLAEQLERMKACLEKGILVLNGFQWGEWPHEEGAIVLSTPEEIEAFLNAKDEKNG
jgi:hypothetical protein